MIGGAAFLVLIGLGVLLVVWDPLRMFRGAPDDMLSWMPGDTRAVEYVDVRAVHKYAAPRRKLETQFGYLDQMGVKLEEVDAVMAGGAARGLPRQTFVVQLSNPADRDQIIRQSGGQSVSAAGKEYYRTNSGMGLHFASDRLLVLTSNHTAMPRVLEQRGGADLPADLKEATGRAHGHIWGVQAIPGNPLGGPGRGADMFGIGSIPSPRYQVNSATFLGGEVKSESLLEFQDATSAQRAGEVFERILGMVRGMGGMPVPGNGRDRMRALESARVEVSGPTVTITNTSPVEGADNVTLPFPF